jgi:hypothetical protein
VRCTLKNHGLIYGYKHFAALPLVYERFHLFGKVKPLIHLPQRQRREMFVAIAICGFLKVQRTVTS